MKKILLIAMLLACAPLSAQVNDPSTTVQSLWKALSHGPNSGADAKALRALFHPEARVFGVTYDAVWVAQFQLRSAEDFIARQAQPGPEPFHEREVRQSVDVYEDFAQVLSTVESRQVEDEPARFVGINSLQLARVNGRWLILSLYYSLEKPGSPFPASFLKE